MNLIQENKLDSHAIIIMGHCEAAERLVDLLLECCYQVEAIIDNNEGKWDTCYRNVPIQSPATKLLPYRNEVSILIVSRHYEAMASQLRAMGYGKQTYKIVDYDTYSEFSLSEATFEQKKKRVEQGIRLLEHLKEQYPDKRFAICPYNALGDVYMACKYFHAFCDRKQVSEEEYVWLVVGNGCAQIPPMFGHTGVKSFKRTEMEALVQAVIFCEEERVSIFHHDRPYTNSNILISNYYPIHFEEHYRALVFGLQEGCQLARPIKTKRREFKELEEGKTVILSPYAKSMSGFPEEYWINIVKKCENRGLKVVTNVAGDEKPIAGTEAIRYAVQDMIAVAEYAGYFIGVRSGLCDVLESAQCKKFILFPEGKYSTTKMEVREFFEGERG